MCFIKGTNEEMHIVAKEDITCYKVIIHNDFGYESMYQHFSYELGRDYGYELDGGLLHRFDDVYETLNSGVFHSYITKDEPPVARELDAIRKKRMYGLYESSGLAITACLVECVIPKGSVYWKNTGYGEYASNKIRLVKVIQEV